MKELVDLALNTINVKGASYGDIRVVERVKETIHVKNGNVIVLSQDRDMGYGVRVIKNGAWGFASSSDFSKGSVERISALAVKVAESSACLKAKDVVLGKASKIQDKHKTYVELDPFSVSVEDKIGLLLQADSVMNKIKGVKISEGALRFWKTNKIFASSEGSFIEQEIIESGGAIEATAVKNGETGNRGYPGFLGGHYKTMGYEFIRLLNFLSHAERVGNEAVALLSAKEFPESITTAVIDGPMVAIQVHESVGHPTELDRVLGTEISLAGASHLTPDKLGKFQLGSPIVNITADATLPGGLGTFGYDDEGIPAQMSYIIKGGVFSGYLTSRETAPLVGVNINGAMRADSWNNIPLIRMTNINVEPGAWKLADLIADTDDGIYIVSPTMPSIDDKRLNYHIGAEVGWKIKNGKLTEMIKRPSYSGISYEIWRNCDAICCKEEWDIWGVPSCGKGDPGQTMHVGHGASPARFRNIKVGR